MERGDVARWLSDYTEAWKSYDRAAIVALFADEARYRYHPYDEPIVGSQAIADSWLGEGAYSPAEGWDRDEPGSYDAAYEPFAVDGTDAVAIGSSTYTNPDGSIRTVYDNCFLIRFDDDGRCAEFVEFFMERPGM
jgi:SnoaL-like domain